ncbi:MAG: Clp protease N-terminal domain-containing protein [Acidimicrobiales bacterium]
MFERFTEGARAALVEAQDLAIELNSRTIDVGHLLYGLAQGREETAGRPLRDSGVAAATVRRLAPRRGQEHTGEIDVTSLESIGIDYDGVRSAVEATFGAGALEAAPDRRIPSPRSGRPRFSDDAKRSLEQSLRVALELHEKTIKPGHVLLGLLRVDDEFVTSVLEESKVNVAGLSSAVLQQLSLA